MGHPERRSLSWYPRRLRGQGSGSGTRWSPHFPRGTLGRRPVGDPGPVSVHEPTTDPGSEVGPDTENDKTGGGVPSAGVSDQSPISHLNGYGEYVGTRVCTCECVREHTCVCIHVCTYMCTCT